MKKGSSGAGGHGRRPALASAVAAACAMMLCAGAALAGRRVHHAGTYEICADDLYLREWAGGPAIDTLPRGSHFEVERTSPSGDWVYGRSRWSEHRGWVENGWFC